jgi:hypothetical protein
MQAKGWRKQKINGEVGFIIPLKMRLQIYLIWNIYYKPIFGCWDCFVTKGVRNYTKMRVYPYDLLMESGLHTQL